MTTGSPSRQIMLRVSVSHPAQPSTWTQITLNNSYQCLLNRLPSCWAIAGRPAPLTRPPVVRLPPQLCASGPVSSTLKDPKASQVTHGWHPCCRMENFLLVKSKMFFGTNWAFFFYLSSHHVTNLISNLKRMNIDWFDWFCVCLFILSKKPWSYTCINYSAFIFFHLWIITHNYFIMECLFTCLVGKCYLYYRRPPKSGWAT